MDVNDAGDATCAMGRMGRVVMEACGLSTWVREEFVALGYEVSLSERNGMAAARVSVSG